MKTLYTAHATADAGRDGSVKTDDGVLSHKLTRPGAGNGTNPEQLFAAGYAACFGSAVAAVAKKQGHDVAAAHVTADVSLNQDDNGYFISAALNVELPSLDQTTAENIVADAHQMCPYSKATRGNIEVTLKVNSQPLAAAA